MKTILDLNDIRRLLAKEYPNKEITIHEYGTDEYSGFYVEIKEVEKK